jgi:phage shock protein C
MNTQRMARSRSERLLGGVAGGLAHSLNVDPIIVRIAFVILALFFNFFSIVAYFALWAFLPSEDSLASNTQDQVRENVAEIQVFFNGTLDRITSLFKS